MKTIYLVRHGETYLNKFYRIQGWCDAPLTNDGEKTVYKIGKKLKNIRFDLAVSSDLKRAEDSRNIIIKENNFYEDIKKVESSLFREEFFGYFDGLDGHEVAKKVSNNSALDTFSKIIANGMPISCIRNKLKELDPFHCCENQVDLGKRVTVAFNWLNDFDDSKTILLIGHGFLTQFIVQMYGGNKFKNVNMPPNSSLTLLNLNDEKIFVKKYGELL